MCTVAERRRPSGPETKAPRARFGGRPQSLEVRDLLKVNSDSPGAHERVHIQRSVGRSSESHR